MITNEVSFLDISKETFNDIERFKQWLYTQRQNMPKNSNKMMFNIVGTRDSVKFHLVKSIHGSVDFKVVTSSGNKLEAKRVKYDNISYIADEIIKYYEHFIHVSLDEI